jgi:hypothetical protein
MIGVLMTHQQHPVTLMAELQIGQGLGDLDIEMIEVENAIAGLCRPQGDGDGLERGGDDRQKERPMHIRFSQLRRLVDRTADRRCDPQQFC